MRKKTYSTQLPTAFLVDYQSLNVLYKKTVYTTMYVTTFSQVVGAYSGHSFSLEQGHTRNANHLANKMDDWLAINTTNKPDGVAQKMS